MWSNNTAGHFMSLCVEFLVDPRFPPWAVCILIPAVFGYAFRHELHASAHLGRTCFVHDAGP